MKKLGLLVIAAALTMAFMSCNNDSNDSAAGNGGNGGTTSPTLTAGTYTSTGNTWDGNNVTVTMTSATAGSFNDGRSTYTFTGMNSSTGELTGGNIDSSTCIIKSGNDFYIVGQALGGTSATLFTDWTWDSDVMTFNSNGTISYKGQTAPFTNSNGFISVTGGPSPLYMFYANNKLYKRVAKITKQ